MKRKWKEDVRKFLTIDDIDNIYQAVCVAYLPASESDEVVTQTQRWKHRHQFHTRILHRVQAPTTYHNKRRTTFTSNNLIPPCKYFFISPRPHATKIFVSTKAHATL